MTAKRRPLPIKQVARQAWINDGKPDTISDSGEAAIPIYEEWTETILTALRDTSYSIVKVQRSQKP